MKNSDRALWEQEISGADAEASNTTQYRHQTQPTPEQDLNIARRVKVALVAGVLAVPTLLGINIVRDNQQVAEAEQELQDRDRTDLMDVNALDQRGGCEEELYAQADYYSRLAGHASTAPEVTETYYAHAERFAVAADLAKANEVSCTPDDPAATSLTPIFDTSKMYINNACPDTIQATAEQSSTDTDQFYGDSPARETLQRELRIELAEAFDIECQ